MKKLLMKWGFLFKPPYLPCVLLVALILFNIVDWSWKLAMFNGHDMPDTTSVLNTFFAALFLLVWILSDSSLRVFRKSEKCLPSAIICIVGLLLFAVVAYANLGVREYFFQIVCDCT